jgi:hypothetical protein
MLNIYGWGGFFETQPVQLALWARSAALPLVRQRVVAQQERHVVQQGRYTLQH